MDSVFNTAKQYESKLDRSLSQHKLFRDAEARTKVPKVCLAIGAALLFLFLAYFNVAGQLLTGFAGWMYPSYESFKAVDVSGAHVKRQWFTYWSVFGLVQTLEYFSPSIIYWIPSYYVFKTLFLLWLALPQFKGAEIVYLHVVLPVAGTPSSSSTSSQKTPALKSPNFLKKDK